MRTWRALLLIAVALAATSCATSDGMGVGSTHDPLTRFPATATWSWDDAANRLPDDSRLESMNLDEIVRQVTRDEFGRRGYSEVSRGRGDFRLHYEIGLATWTSQTSATALGSISLTFVEPSSGRRVWVGFIRAEVDVNLDQEARTERIRTELRKLLETFPPGSA